MAVSAKVRPASRFRQGVFLEKKMPTDPMQAFLAGAMWGMLDKHGRDFMKIVEIIPGNAAPTGFEVQFASGLRLQVSVDVINPASPLPSPPSEQ